MRYEAILQNQVVEKSQGMVGITKNSKIIGRIINYWLVGEGRIEHPRHLSTAFTERPASTYGLLSEIFVRLRTLALKL